jgi:hypothetical protein
MDQDRNKKLRSDLVFYVGGSEFARTSLALSRVPICPRSVVVSSSLSARDFRGEYAHFLSRPTIGNIVPLFSAHDLGVVHLNSVTAASLNAMVLDHVFFERLATRPADVTKTIGITVALANFARLNSATVSAGIYAADDSEALTLEQSLIDMGVTPHALVACWLNGPGNSSVRYVRIAVESLQHIKIKENCQTGAYSSFADNFGMILTKKGVRV